MALPVPIRQDCPVDGHTPFFTSYGATAIGKFFPGNSLRETAVTMSRSTLDRSLPLLKWNLDMYYTAARAGVFEGHRVELLDGNLFEIEMPEPMHEWLIEAIKAYLQEMLGDRALVREAKPVTLSNDSEPIPDVSVVRKQDYRRHHPSPEDIYLIIEIANSNPGLDTKTKHATYARAGIFEYWVFNLVKQELRVFRDIHGNGDTADYTVDLAWSTDTIEIRAFSEVELSAIKLKQLAFD